MTQVLSHRGPDGQGTWMGPNVGLGHTRLAIIDAVGGAQPMTSSNGRYTTVFNGEIYNFQQLKKDLAAQGYQFITNSDTEVIWASIEAWGVERGLQSLRGMFAFALYDSNDQSLLIARDRVGIKPVFWAESAGTILFASEQKAILEAGLVERRLNPVAIHDYLAHGYSSTPDTCWANIQQLEPGTWKMFRRNGHASGRYWQWAPTETYTGTVSEGTDALQSVLEESVRCHLISDVPVGAFLSGGLDSSLITSLMSGAKDTRPDTFSVAFGDRSHDESEAARAVAVHCGTRHHELTLEMGEGDPDLLRTIVEQYDEPFGDSSCIPTYLMCREVRNHVKVVLSGDGGDEVLGGYVRYQNVQRLATLEHFGGKTGWLRPLVNMGTALLGRTGARVRKAFELTRMRPPERLCALQNYFSEEDRRSLYAPTFQPAAIAQGPTVDRFSPLLPTGVRDPVQQMIAAEMRMRLHADYLRKVDVASSAHGLEVRVPFLDNSMLDFGASLPVSLKLAHGETKLLARGLVKKLLPPAIARRPKQGFSLPLDSWAGPEMRSYFQELLLGPQSRSSALLDRTAVKKTWDDFDGPPSDPSISRYQRYQRVFLLVALELWLRRWKVSVS